MNPSPLVVDVTKPTVASILQSQGYATACFGKWHLGFGDKPRPDWNADLTRTDDRWRMTDGDTRDDR
jgi:arylsulfatase A-like enzyme